MVPEQKFEEAAERAIAAAREDLLAYCMLMDPSFIIGPHHQLISDKLMQVWQGDIKRLMLFMPPRSSKSYMTSRFFPSFCLGHTPS